MIGKGSLKPQRFLTAVDLEAPELLEVASRQLWMRIWGRVRHWAGQCRGAGGGGGGGCS